MLASKSFMNTAFFWSPDKRGWVKAIQKKYTRDLIVLHEFVNFLCIKFVKSPVVESRASDIWCYALNRNIVKKFSLKMLSFISPGINVNKLFSIGINLNIYLILILMLYTIHNVISFKL